MTAGVIILPYALVGALGNVWLAFGSFYARRDILSGNAANIWWIVNYVLRAWYQIGRLGDRRRLSRTGAAHHGDQHVSRGRLPESATVRNGTVSWRPPGGGCGGLRHTRDLALHCLGAAFIVHAFFVLSVGVHEHHMMLAVPLLALAAGLRPSLRPLFWIISAIVALNMNLFYGIGMGLGWSVPRGILLVDLSVWLSVANIAALVWHGRVLVREAGAARVSAEWRLERRAIPLRGVCGRDVSRLAGTASNSASGSSCRAHGVVRQDELAQLGTVERLARIDLPRPQIPAVPDMRTSNTRDTQSRRRPPRIRSC